MSTNYVVLTKPTSAGGRSTISRHEYKKGDTTLVVHNIPRPPIVQCYYTTVEMVESKFVGVLVDEQNFVIRESLTPCGPAPVDGIAAEKPFVLGSSILGETLFTNTDQPYIEAAPCNCGPMGTPADDPFIFGSTPLGDHVLTDTGNNVPVGSECLPACDNSSTDTPFILGSTTLGDPVFTDTNTKCDAFDGVPTPDHPFVLGETGLGTNAFTSLGAEVIPTVPCLPPEDCTCAPECEIVYEDISLAYKYFPSQRKLVVNTPVVYDGLVVITY